KETAAIKAKASMRPRIWDSPVEGILATKDTKLDFEIHFCAFCDFNLRSPPLVVRDFANHFTKSPCDFFVREAFSKSCTLEESLHYHSPSRRKRRLCLNA